MIKKQLIADKDVIEALYKDLVFNGPAQLFVTLLVDQYCKEGLSEIEALTKLQYFSDKWMSEIEPTFSNEKN